MSDLGDRLRSTLVVYVEDDRAIGSTVRDALVADGHHVNWVLDGTSARRALADHTPDLILLDAGLPDVDGLTLCRELHEQWPAIPIIIVTARDADIDIVVGLDAGASDYVTKPFSTTVLLARVRAHLRRTDQPDSGQRSIAIGALYIEPQTYTITKNGEPVALRRREFELLVHLGRELGHVVTRERLLADLWSLHWTTTTKTLDMHVLALRRKLGDVIEIVAVRGVGYRLTAR